jgi:hypothetical protein
MVPELTEVVVAATLVAELDSCGVLIGDVVSASRAAMESASVTWFGRAEQEAAVALGHLHVRLASIAADLAATERNLRWAGVANPDGWSISALPDPMQPPNLPGGWDGTGGSGWDGTGGRGWDGNGGRGW